MTSSNTFNKFLSIGAAALLALGGSLVATEPANATPITNIKSMDYQMDWIPGGTLEATFTAGALGFNSGLKMDDVTALRGQTLTVGSVNTGLANGVTLTDYAYITFYASIADRNAQYPTIGQGTQVYNSGPSSQTQLVVPSTAVAMRISYTTRFNGNGYETLAAGNYGSTPHVFSNSVEIPISTSSSGSSLYTDYSYGEVEGATSAFTTPATGNVRSTSFEIAGCIDMSAVTSSTTYTARLKVNGTVVSGMTDYVVSSLGGSSYAEVMGASNSFGSGQLSTWRTAGQALKITVRTNNNSSFVGNSTQYDSTLELVDQSSTSLLKDCTPATPAGSGTLSASSTPGMLSFTPDSTLGALASWYINIYKSSDNSLATVGMGQGTAPANIPAPFGQSGPGSWTVGQSYYAKAVNSVTINGRTIESELGTASPAFTIPTNFSGGGGGNVGGGGAPAMCSPAIVLTNIAYSQPTIDPTASVRRIYNNDPAIGTSTPCLAGFSSSNVGTLATLNGAVVGTPTRYTGLMASVSNSITSWAGLTSGILAGRTLSDGDVYRLNYYVGIAQTPTLSDTPTFTLSLILNPTGTSGNNSNGISVSVAPSEPAPVWQGPLLNAVVGTAKNIGVSGGKLALTGGDFAGLKSVTVAGKDVAFTTDSNGSVSIPVPSGKAGVADLTMVFTTGTITIHDGIKYVTPTVVASVPERAVAIAAGTKKITEAVADQVRQAAFANMSNTSVQCVAYSASSKSAAKAAAKATAAALCALAVKANPALSITAVNVVVNKTRAAKEAVGIKVYKK
jgi:hypothetical protein